MTPLDYDSYRTFIFDFISLHKGVGSGLTHAQVAKKAHIQRSYLTNVLKGRGNLNADQLHAIGRALKLGDTDLDDLQLLLEIDRCQLPERMRSLQAKLKARRRDYLRSESALVGRQEVSEDVRALYYGDPYCQLVHMFMAVPQYRKAPKAICEVLHISEERLRQILRILEQARVLLATADGYEVADHSLHVSRDSWLSRVLTSHFRLKAIEYSQRATNDADYFFTASFAATEATRVKLHGMWFKALKEMAAEIGDAPAEAVFHLNFDLFRI